MQKLGILIPARMNSSRLYGKPLLNFCGLPMIEHVRRRANLNSKGLEVIVVSGDNEILETVSNFGGNTFRSTKEHPNGFSRTSEAVNALGWSHFILVQGDEILVLPNEIDLLANNMSSSPNKDFINCVAPLTSLQELDDVSVVKGTLNNDGSISMMFRANPFIGNRDEQVFNAHKVLGLFGMKSQVALDYVNLEPTKIEALESIEQMRLIENSIKVYSLQLPKSTTSVNTQMDVIKINEILASDTLQREIFQMIS